MRRYAIGAGLLLLIMLALAISNNPGLTSASAQLAATTNGTPYAPLPAQKPDDGSLLGKPTISAHFIDQVLAAYHSPATGTGQQLYDLGVQAGIDPAYALAFFLHESRFGTTGEARVTLSLGNERCIPDRPCIDQDRGGYAQMESWVDGYAHWYALIRNLYVTGAINQYIGRNACPCTTIPQIIPVYAPSSDGNDEQAYISAILHAVQTWRAGRIFV